MTILITGGSGFIGGALARRLLSQGAPVRVLVRDPGRAVSFTKAGAEIVQGDVTDVASCMKAADGAETVFHCAGVLGGWGRPESLLMKVNYEGTRNMLRAAKEADVARFVHTSSCGIFGPLKTGEAAGDDHPYNPTNGYERSKAEAEKLALGYSKADLPVTVIRPEFVYGPGDLHLLSLFRTVKCGRFAFFGDGSSTLHPTYIEDAVDSLILASENPDAAGVAMNIAGERPVTVREFIGSMSEAMNVPIPNIIIPIPIAKAAGLFFDYTLGLVMKPPLTYAQVGYLSENRAFSFERAKRVLGYYPKVGLKEGIAKTVGWYRSEGLL